MNERPFLSNNTSDQDPFRTNHFFNINIFTFKSIRDHLLQHPKLLIKKITQLWKKINMACSFLKKQIQTIHFSIKMCTVTPVYLEQTFHFTLGYSQWTRFD